MDISLGSLTIAAIWFGHFSVVKCRAMVGPAAIEASALDRAARLRLKFARLSVVGDLQPRVVRLLAQSGERISAISPRDLDGFLDGVEFCGILE